MTFKRNLTHQLERVVASETQVVDGEVVIAVNIGQIISE
jgi:hypothetical protein